MLPQGKKSITYCPLTSKQLFMTVFACKRCLIHAYLPPDSDKMTLSLEKNNSMDRGLGLKLKCLNDDLYSYKRATFHFTICELMDRSGVDYCNVFISRLDSHSDGTHSLQMIH